MITLNQYEKEAWEHKFIKRFGHRPDDTEGFDEEDYSNLYHEWIEEEYNMKYGGL